MAIYESPRYKELGFYVDGAFRRFSGGFYHTEDSAEIAVLDVITDCVRVVEEIPEEPTPKAPSQRKSSAK
jgi:hypothetical protein